MESWHPYSWLFWLLAAALPAMVTHNPLYLTLLLLAGIVTYLALSRAALMQPYAHSQATGGRIFLRFALLIGGFTILFNGLTVHYGRLVLFRFPPSWPLLGGIITGEALLYGLANALSLVALIWAFTTFNLAIGREQLLQLVPNALFYVGLIVSIGVALVPATVQTWQQIREAQQLRGYHFRRWSDYLPLLVPLLAGSLEGAIHLAESMEGRGFGGRITPQPPRSVRKAQIILLLALFLLLSGLLARGYWPQKSAYGLALLFGGSFLLLWLLYRQGKQVHRSRYHRWLWHRADRLMIVLALLQLVALMAVLCSERMALIYYPYPPYSPWPNFHPLIGLLMIVPAWPGLHILLQPSAGAQALVAEQS